MHIWKRIRGCLETVSMALCGKVMEDLRKPCEDKQLLPTGKVKVFTPVKSVLMTSHICD